MAALTRTELVKRFTLGDRVLQTFRATSGGGANAADEWIDTGLSFIDAVVGVSVIGTATGVTHAVVKNANGTGVTAGTNPGNLGVEFSGATATFEVTVIGRP